MARKKKRKVPSTTMGGMPTVATATPMTKAMRKQIAKVMGKKKKRKGWPMAKKRNWIKGAIKHPGALTKKAKKAGMSVSAYAKKVTKKGSKASARTKRQANLAKTLKKLRGRPG